MFDPRLNSLSKTKGLKDKMRIRSQSPSEYSRTSMA